MNSIVKIAPSFVKKETGPEVSRDLPPHSGTHRTGSVGGHWRWGSGSTGPARQMTRQPRHESGRAGANGPRGCPSLLGRLVGRGRAPPPWLTCWRRCSPGTGALVNTYTESEKRRPRVATIAMRAWIRRSTRWSTVRRERGRAATSSWKSDGTSRLRRTSRHCWWAREGGGPWPPSVSKLCFGRRQRRGWGCGTPTPRGSASGGAAIPGCRGRFSSSIPRNPREVHPLSRRASCEPQRMLSL